MESLVYALFDNHDQAARAVDDMIGHGVPQDVISVVMHEGALHHEEVQGPGTRSRRFAVTGGLSIGAVTAVLSGLLASGAGLVGFGPLAVAIFSGGYGTLLGGLVAAIAGSSEARPELERLATEVEQGKVLVTVDLASRRSAVGCETFLERHGAHHIGMF